jgi:hypothetical protein
VGAIAVTSAGGLPAKYIIHAVTIDWRNNVWPTSRTIRQLMREILSRCEALGIVRLAIPALATGAAGLAPVVSAGIIARGLREHAENPTGLRSVVMPVPEVTVREAFARELARPFLEDITAMRGPYDEPDALRMDAAQVPRGAHTAEVVASPPASRLRKWWTRVQTQSQPRSFEAANALLGRAASHPTAGTIANDKEFRPVLDGRYVILQEVGRGGTAVVHMAWDLVLRRVVAIKVLKPNIDADALKREAAAALDLTHESIVRTYHFEPGDERRGGYLVMEYVTWPSGEKWIADAGLSGLPVRSVVDVAARICRAVAFAHSHSLLHLDIKPGKIFVDPAGEHAKLGDFGLARIASTGGRALQLHSAGTPAYMAPEQRLPGATVTPATDVYQLAATMWDLLTGHPPRPPDLQIEEPEPPRRQVLQAIVDALSLEPGRRPSAAQLAELMMAAV